MQPDSKTPLEFFLTWEKLTPDRVFLRQPLGGHWHDYTYGRAGREARSIGRFLKSLGLAPGGKVAILSKNCAHWFMADLAIMMAGYISVPIFPTLSTGAIRAIIEHSEVDAIFVGKLDEYEKQQAGIPSRLTRISFDMYGIRVGQTWTQLLEINEPMTELCSRDANSTATIMYSSGTTGSPKGVMLTHDALAFAGTQFATHLGLHSPQCFFSYLPLSHIAERAVLQMVAIYSGSSVSFTESLDLFNENLRHEQPTVFGGVPRIWSRIQSGVLTAIGQKKLDVLLSIPGVNRIVKRKILGGIGLAKAKICVSGAAPIAESLLRWYEKLGITIREIYGMTENTALATACFKEVRLGSVGKPFPGVDMRLSKSGEILIKHNALMQGYYKDREGTSNAFTHDGYLRTGDVGFTDADGFLYITGRIKDQFKTDKGKFISPSPIETKLLTNSDLEHVCVVGAGLPQPIVLVLLSAQGKAKSHEEIAFGLSMTLEGVNKTLETFEELTCAVILGETWTIENGLLTPSLKMKRFEIERIHCPNYGRWFASGRRVVWA